MASNISFVGKTNKKRSRRSRRISGLPPLQYPCNTAQHIGENAPVFSRRTRVRRKRIKTPQKRDILQSASTIHCNGSMQAPDTNESDSCDSDFEVMEGMQKETKTGNGVPTSMTQSCSPDIGVSDNEHDKDEDEKDLILVHHETPKGHEQPPRASSSQYMHHPPMPFLEGQGGAYTSFTPNAHSHDARSRETYDPKYKLLVIVLCLSMAHCVPYNPFKVLLSVILYAVMHCILLEIVHCTTQKQQRRNDAADEMLVYVISNTINATFVVSHFTYSVYCAAYEQCVDMSPRSSVACISFGLFLSHLCRFIW
eukprot:CAMPEP_0202708176 /NCGR_PEP_ID=MMETSP1385-20130828/20430_1 /ASSEMBLY_ACC=CAM_ASM_000861 /TAXON_ID=933848 /ORGANISM="Elphidium margaritaceum" /LENGTH=309 /DNA_ID=CAMNT_0049367089 /DNA_START=57 /DNA_END=983 /DNA_ORIENTATION=+